MADRTLFTGIQTNVNEDTSENCGRMWAGTNVSGSWHLWPMETSAIGVIAVASIRAHAT